MRPDDRPEIFQAPAKDELESRHPVKKDAIGDNPKDMAIGKVLVKQREVVPEIEVSLPRRTFGKRPSPDMIDNRLRAAIHLEAQVLHPPAKVDLLHVGEEGIVETAMQEV